MAEECSPLLSTSLEADAVEEIHLMSVSSNSEPNETEVKTIVVNNFEERISNETEVKTVAVYEDRDEVVTSDTTPLLLGKSTIYLCLIVLRTGMMPTLFVVKLHIHVYAFRQEK